MQMQYRQTRVVLFYRSKIEDGQAVELACVEMMYSNTSVGFVDLILLLPTYFL
jgi:hypothetical protein